MAEPTIKILFTGLLDFYWDGADKFEIGVAKEEQHCLSIGIEKKVAGNRVYKVLTYFPTPVGGACNPVVIKGDEVRLNVIKEGGAAPKPAQQIGFPQTTPDDLRYCINMDGLDFHDSPNAPLLHFDKSFSPIIHINHGIFSSEVVVDVTQERMSGAVVKPRLPIAWYVCASINLNPAASESAKLMYGVDLEQSYPFDLTENAKYVVFVENGCFMDLSSDPDFTDFGSYYNYFDIRPPAARHRLRKIGMRIDPLLDTHPVIDYTRTCVWGADKNNEIRTRDNPCDPIYTRHKYW